jgi:hypothetical protein
VLFWGLTYRLTFSQFSPLNRTNEGCFSTMRPMNLPVHKIRSCFTICGRVYNHSRIWLQMRRHACLLNQWNQKVYRRCHISSSTSILSSFPSARVFCMFSYCVERKLSSKPWVFNPRPARPATTVVNYVHIIQNYTII